MVSTNSTNNNLGSSTGVGSSDPFSNADQSLANCLQEIYADPTNPDLIDKFMKYLMDNPAEFSSWMMTQDNMQSKLPSMLYELFLKAFYEGLPSTEGGTGQGGAADANAFIQFMRSHLPKDSPFADAMNKELNYLDFLLNDTNFVANNTNAQGERTWTITDANGNPVVIVWNDPSNQGRDKVWENATIDLMIANGESSGTSAKYTENPYVDGGDDSVMNSLLAQFRKKALEAIWGSTHNIMMLIMYLVLMYDNSYQIQIGGSAATTNDMTKLTQSFTTPLAQLAQKIGPDFTSDDAKQMVGLFSAASAIVNSMPQTSSFKDAWNSTVSDTFLNASADINGTQGKTIGDWITDYLNDPTTKNLDNLRDAFRSLNPAPTSGPSTTNPGYTQVVNAFQTAGSMPTGRSKIESQKLQVVTGLEQQDDALGKSNVSTTGGGFMQFLQMLINNQISK